MNNYNLDFSSLIFCIKGKENLHDGIKLAISVKNIGKLLCKSFSLFGHLVELHDLNSFCKCNKLGFRLIVKGRYKQLNRKERF